LEILEALMKKLNVDRTHFKDDMQRYRTQALFFEYYADQEFAVFTLKDEDFEADGKKYIALKPIYLAMSDPTEYSFAMYVFDSWPHWARLRKYYLKDHVAMWREEMEMKLVSEGIQQNIKLAKAGNYNAAKWLADKGWEEKRGRPTKAEKEGRLKQDTAQRKELEADMARIGLVAIK
jgi:hypothetical protein